MPNLINIGKQGRDDVAKAVFDNFSINLRNERIERDFSLDEVASMTRISALHLGRFEKGEELPNLENLAMLCSLYGKTPNDLLLSSTEWQPTEMKNRRSGILVIE